MRITYSTADDLRHGELNLEDVHEGDVARVRRAFDHGQLHVAEGEIGEVAGPPTTAGIPVRMAATESSGDHDAYESGHVELMANPNAITIVIDPRDPRVPLRSRGSYTAPAGRVSLQVLGHALRAVARHGVDVFDPRTAARFLSQDLAAHVHLVPESEWVEIVAGLAKQADDDGLNQGPEAPQSSPSNALTRPGILQDIEWALGAMRSAYEASEGRPPDPNSKSDVLELLRWLEHDLRSSLPESAYLDDQAEIAQARSLLKRTISAVDSVPEAAWADHLDDARIHARSLNGPSADELAKSKPWTQPKPEGWYNEYTPPDYAKDEAADEDDDGTRAPARGLPSIGPMAPRLELDAPDDALLDDEANDDAADAPAPPVGKPALISGGELSRVPIGVPVGHRDEVPGKAVKVWGKPGMLVWNKTTRENGVLTRADPKTHQVYVRTPDGDRAWDALQVNVAYKNTVPLEVVDDQDYKKFRSERRKMNRGAARVTPLRRSGTTGHVPVAQPVQ